MVRDGGEYARQGKGEVGWERVVVVVAARNGKGSREWGRYKENRSMEHTYTVSVCTRLYVIT